MKPCIRAIAKLGLLLPLLVGVAFAQFPFGRGNGPQKAQTPKPLAFHFVGPPPGGRIASAVGVPGNPKVYYLGSASGGVWKSTDGGHTFKPIFDHEDAQAIGALAIAPSNPNIVWAGTGEAWVIREIDLVGDGIYKSTNAGATWTRMGLKKTGRIGRIVVDPDNANIVYACALGTTFGPQRNRGVFKTTDGGLSWKRVLFVNRWTGCSGLSIDPKDPNTLLAGTWQVLMHSWGLFSGMWKGYTGKPGSGVYITHDGGATWKHLTNGLPKPPLGKIDVAIAPSQPSRMYALIQTARQGSVWRSDDGGATWKDVNWDRRLIGRAGYYIRIAVDPFNANHVLLTNSSFYQSTNGGVTFHMQHYDFRPGAPRVANCGDCHDIWMDPKIPNRYVLTDDAGASISTGTTALRVTLPNGQMYHVATDNRVPYWIYSNRQDDGTMRGPSDAPAPTGNGKLPGVAQPPGRGGRGRGGEFGFRRPAPPAWQGGLGGCESGFTLPALHDPNVVWASCYGDEVTRWSASDDTARSVSPWMHTLDSPPNLLKYRCHWTPPLAIDPFDGSVYYGCQVIFQTKDQGQTWKVISPDLSRDNPAHIVPSGGIVQDNLGQFYGDVVFAIAPSPVQRHLIWAGTNDARVWYTPDGGGHWVNVTRNIPGLPRSGVVAQISPSTFNPGGALVVVDRRLDGDFNPYIYRTTDFGKTWTNISSNLPRGGVVDFARSAVQDPNHRGLLFAGTGNGFYYSTDDGARWTHFRGGLPPTEVNWITVQKRQHDVVVATYGRGIWVLPDITTLEQTGSTAVPGDTTRLFAPRDGIRMPRAGSAQFLFSLASAPAAPLRFKISDAAGHLIRTFAVEAHAGLNRATWNLRYTAPIQVALRTTPSDDPTIWSEPRFAGKDTRPIDHWGIQGAQRAGPLAAPGQYTVSVAVNGETLSAPFTVVKDPAIKSSDADLEASTRMQIRVRNDMDEAATLINRLEIARRQVQNDLAAHPGGATATALHAIGAKLENAELLLLTHEDLNSDDKYYTTAYRVYMNLIWFNGEIGTGAGDVAGGADYQPTAVSYPILAGIERKLAAAKTAYTHVITVDLAAFNRSMAGKLAPVTVTP